MAHSSVVVMMLSLLLLGIKLTEEVKPWNALLKSSMSARLILVSSATATAFLTTPLDAFLPSNAYAGTSARSNVQTRVDSDAVSKKVDDIPFSYDLSSELENYEADTESLLLKQRRQPYSIMAKLEKSFSANKMKVDRDITVKSETLEAQVQDAQERVLTLAAYLDEIERDLFSKNWDNLQVYLYTFAEQENAFAILIDFIFPENTKLDQSEREALSAEAKAMFLALDDLREAAKYKQFKAAEISYAKLLLSYDRFLKAGDLYPTYDPITSTEVFFKDTPKYTLRYDSKAKVQVLDRVLMTEGPDMGKTGTTINIDGNNEYAVVKLDKDGKAYNEVKYVKLKMLAKTLDDR